MGEDEPLASALDEVHARRPARHRHRVVKRSLLGVIALVIVQAVMWSPSASVRGAAPAGDALPPVDFPVIHPLFTPTPTPTPDPTASATPTATPTPGSGPPAGSPSLQLDAANLGAPYASALNGVEGPGNEVFDRGAQAWSSGVPSVLSPLHLHFERCCQPVNPQYCPSSSDCTYHWNAWQASNADISPQAAVSSFHQVAAAGDTPLFLVNVDRGTPEEAAGFVQEVNVTLGAHVGWWEIGNEEDTSPAFAGNLPPACQGTAGGSFGQMYGCVVHAYAQAMRAVDPSIHIVANYDGAAINDMLAAAGSDIDALDVHEYTPPADPGTTTFTADNQTQSYGVDMPLPTGLTEVTIAVWAAADEWAGLGPPALHIAVDGKSLTSVAPGTSAARWTPVARGAYAPWAEPVVAYTPLAPGHHVITVTACTGYEVSFSGCAGNTTGKWSLAVRGITWSPPVNGVVMPQPSDVEARNEANSCLGSSGPDMRIDSTPVDATQPGSTTQPWRLSQSDFDLAFTDGYAGYTRNELEGPTNNGRSLRERLDAYNAAPPSGAAPWHGSVIIGEYATFGGCAAVPRTLTESMAGAMGDAVELMNLVEDSSRSTYPIVAASHFALDSVDSKQCLGWTVAWTTTCAPGSTPYLGAEGAALSMIWSLSGSRVPATLLSCPQVTTGQLSVLPPLAGSPLLRALAYQPGAAGTVQVAVANLSPTQSYALPIWDSGHVVSYVSSQTVTAADSAYNDAADPHRVAAAANVLAHVATNSWTTVTLPPFSISVVTVSIA